MVSHTPGVFWTTGRTGWPPNRRGRTQFWVSTRSPGFGTRASRSMAMIRMPCSSNSSTRSSAGSRRRWPNSMNRPYQPAAVKPTAAAAPMIPSFEPHARSDECPCRLAGVVLGHHPARTRQPELHEAGQSWTFSAAMQRPGSLPVAACRPRCFSARSASSRNRLPLRDDSIMRQAELLWEV